MIETSIIFCHYSEDEDRDMIARKSLLSAYSQRNESTELIIVFNGIYPYRNDFIKYADQWHEREADPSPGRSVNIGNRLAKGEIIFCMANDTFLEPGAVAECVRLIKKYPQHMVTPIYPPKWKHKRSFPLIDGYLGNKRAGDLALCMTKTQINDLGPHQENYVWKDEVEYINRRVAKGYVVMLTKNPMGYDMAPKVHSFIKQIKQFNLQDENLVKYVWK